MSKKIVIDSGHGGEDGGASGNGIIEKDLTLKISKYMQQRFDELGIPNQMTRTEDITLNPTDRVNKVLSFLLEHIDVIISAVIGLLGGMQIAKIIIKNNINNNIKNSPGSSIYNGDINVSKNKK